MQDELDERPRQKSNPTLVAAASLITAILVVGVNISLVYAAAQDLSWGALGILIMIGPITNGVIALVAFVSSFFLRWLAGGTSVMSFAFAGVLLPVVAIVVDAILIF